MRLRLSFFSHTIAFVFGAYGVGLFLIGPCLTAFAETYRVSLAVAGMSFAAFSLGFLACVFLAGYLYERVSRKWATVLGIGLIGASLLFFAAAPTLGARPTFAAALAALTLLGVGGALLEVAGNALITDLNPERAALAVNYAHALLAIGAVAGPWMAGQLMQAGVSWQVPYAIAGGCCIAMTCALALQREPRVARGAVMRGADMRALLGRGVMWVAFVGIVLYVAAETGVVGWVPSFLEKTLHASKAGAASAVSVFWLAMTAGRFICTWGAHWLRPQVFVALLAALGAAAALGIPAAGSVGACYLFVALSGLTFSGIFGMVLAHAAAELGQYLGAAYGVIVSGVAVGSLLFPPAMGWIAQVTSRRAGLVVPAALLAALTGLYLPYAVRRPRATADHVPSGEGAREQT